VRLGDCKFLVSGFWFLALSSKLQALSFFPIGSLTSVNPKVKILSIKIGHMAKRLGNLGEKPSVRYSAAYPTCAERS